jgi:hypothetical protein
MFQTSPWMNLRDGRMAWFSTAGGNIGGSPFRVVDQAAFSSPPSVWWGWRNPGHMVYPPEPGWQIPGPAGVWLPAPAPPQCPPVCGPPPGDCFSSCNCFVFLLTHYAPWYCYWQDEQFNAWLTGQQPWPATQAQAEAIMQKAVMPLAA